MKNKFQDSIRANHIDFVLSEILLTVGAVLLLMALIILSNEDYGYGEKSSLLEMQRYGLALVISGTLSMITCALNIANKSNDTVSGGTSEKVCDMCGNSVEKLQSATIGDDTVHICPECAKKSLSDEQNQPSDY